jgi:hypothetical protein
MPRWQWKWFAWLSRQWDMRPTWPAWRWPTCEPEWLTIIELFLIFLMIAYGAGESLFWFAQLFAK